MEILCEKYVANLDAACGLVKPRVTWDMHQEQAIEAIRSGAERLYRIHQENDEILRQILFSKTAETLTAQEADSLSRLADQLFSYNRSPDTGIAYRIHKLLYEYGRHRQDSGLMIRELYYQGITLLYLNVMDSHRGKGLFDDKINECFREGASYLERYEDIKDAQARAYAIRCLGNIKQVLRMEQGGEGEPPAEKFWREYMECFDKAMEVLQSPRYRQMDSEIPWDNFIYTMHYDRTRFLSNLRDGQCGRAIAEGVMESAEYVYRHQEQLAKTKNRAIGTRTRYVYAAARYHAGLGTAEELVETLFEMCETANLEEFSGDTIWVMLYTPEYLMHYSKCLPEERRLEVLPRVRAAVDRQKEYLFKLPRNEYALQVSRIFQSIVGYVANEDSEFCERMLDYILACHPPTFVHSKVVALLTKKFCSQMAKVRPELLKGVFGMDMTEGTTASLDVVLELAYQSGLRHDLGKCMLLNYIGLYSRRLLDEEFACIKQHTGFGCELLKIVGMEDMANVAHYHHRSYDGAGGYPQYEQECPDSIRPIVDIITVVDSLDAGTDNVGRSYAAAKSYERLVEELRAGKGTRYAPAVVELLDDPAFYEETKRFLAESRRQVYVEVYCAAL